MIIATGTYYGKKTTIKWENGNVDFEYKGSNLLSKEEYKNRQEIILRRIKRLQKDLIVAGTYHPQTEAEKVYYVLAERFFEKPVYGDNIIDENEDIPELPYEEGVIY